MASRYTARMRRLADDYGRAQASSNDAAAAAEEALLDAEVAWATRVAARLAVLLQGKGFLSFNATTGIIHLTDGRFEVIGPPKLPAP
jgi:hypothetical protein